MKSYAGFKFLKLPPASLLHLSSQLPSVFWSEAPWRVSAASPSLGRAQLSSSPCHHSVVAGVCLAKSREHLASLRKPLLPSDTKHATYLHCCLVGPIFPMSPRGNRNQASPSTPPPLSFVPTIQLWKISEGHRSGSTLWCLYWLAPFPFYFFF